MPYIYKIINTVNDKVYVGKTMGTIETRWKEHCADYQRDCHANRAIYRAMKKYGIDQFSAVEIEECSDKELADREIYWVEKLQSFQKGYNLTLGGDGRPHIDYDLVVATYKKLKIKKDVAKELNIHPDSVSNILKSRDVADYDYRKEYAKGKKPVNMLTLSGELLKSFSSMGDAARYLIENDLTQCKFTTIRYHITEVCQGKRKTIARFKWEYRKE